MANSGPNTNGCRFLICCKDLPHLDGKHVVFGQVVEGFEVIDMIENTKVDPHGRPFPSIKLSECGEM